MLLGLLSTWLSVGAEAGFLVVPDGLLGAALFPSTPGGWAASTSPSLLLGVVRSDKFQSTPVCLRALESPVEMTG